MTQDEVDGYEEEIASLRAELDATKTRLATLSRSTLDAYDERDDAVRTTEEIKKEKKTDIQELAAMISDLGRSQSMEATPSSSVVFSRGRKIDRFKDRPQGRSDQSISEWIRDVESQLESRQLSKADQYAYILENLAGKARQEILGRAEELDGDPEKAFVALRKTFGDGDTLPQLLQRFFGYRQTSDVITCSLDLVDLFDQIIKQDPTMKPQKTVMLKDRFAEAVTDEGLQRELRRLNVERPELSFFELRDRAVQWLGGPSRVCLPRKTTSESVSADASSLQQLKSEIVKEVVDALSQREPARPPRACFECGSFRHIRRFCPKLKGHQQAGPASHATGTAGAGNTHPSQSGSLNQVNLP
jgi:hypothetical protein